MKRQFVVTIDLPEGAKVNETRHYIFDAVTTWRGQLHPADPLFGLTDQDVHVKRLQNPPGINHLVELLDDFLRLHSTTLGQDPEKYYSEYVGFCNRVKKTVERHSEGDD